MLKGKQIVDTTVTQQKLDLVLPVTPQDAATKEYVDLNRSAESNTSVDLNLVANLVVADGELATDSAISEQPVVGTEVLVYVLGQTVNINETADAGAFFSPDGTYKRIPGAIRKGDKLYWNPTNTEYFLDSSDMLDFQYLISNKENRIIDLAQDVVETLVPDQYLFDLFGDFGSLTTATVIIDGTSYPVANSFGNFIFDYGDGNGDEYTFATVGENITVNINAADYTIVWDGEESDTELQKFSIIPA